MNKVEYEYSTNDVDWITINMTDITSPLANKEGDLSLATSTGYVRFRITLRKRYTTSTSPKWNSIRFRYRNHVTLQELDPRFNITIPSFLASREQQVRQIEQGEYGWTTKFPLNWWTLPDADIHNTDIIMFIQGRFINQMFQVSKVREYTYGEHLQLLHKGFEGNFIRDENELLGILHYLL